MSVSLRKQRDKPSENRIFKKENKYGNLSIIHHSQRLPKGTFRTAWGGKPCVCPPEIISTDQGIGHKSRRISMRWRG